jgi:hypothetical protein
MPTRYPLIEIETDAATWDIVLYFSGGQMWREEIHRVSSTNFVSRDRRYDAAVTFAFGFAAGYHARRDDDIEPPVDITADGVSLKWE